MNLHTIILCGGKSERMGCDKAALDFHGEPMLARVIRLLTSEIPTERIKCVAASGQTLPTLLSEVTVVTDRKEDCGPLEGLATGLETLNEPCFVTTCDAPLLSPDLPTYLAGLLGDHDAAVPRIDGQLYPLTAVYRPSVLQAANARLARGERRVIDFVAELNTRYISGDELRTVDAELHSLQTCNTREEYEALLGLAEID